MQPSWKKAIQGLLYSLLVLLPLQVAPQANSITESLPVVGTPMSRDQVKNSLVIQSTSCARDAYTQPAGTAVAQLATQWLNQWGQAKVVLADRLSGPDLGSSHLALLLPAIAPAPLDTVACAA